MNLSDYSETRFIALMLIIVVSSAAMFLHYLDGHTWAWLMSCALAMFTAHCAVDDKLPDAQKRRSHDPDH